MLLFFKESWKEIRYRVDWSNYDKIQRYSKAVVVGSIFLSIFIGIIDLTVKYLINKVYY